MDLTTGIPKRESLPGCWIDGRGTASSPREPARINLSKVGSFPCDRSASMISHVAPSIPMTMTCFEADAGGVSPRALKIKSVSAISDAAPNVLRTNNPFTTDDSTTRSFKFRRRRSTLAALHPAPSAMQFRDRPLLSSDGFDVLLEARNRNSRRNNTAEHRLEIL